MNANGYGVSLGADKPVLQLPKGDISHACECTKSHSIMHLKG